MIGVSLLIFPKLALGLSGFETGVAVMPHVQGDPDDTEEKPVGRIRDTRKLLTTAGADHERLPDRQQLRHHRADPAGRVQGRRHRRTAARWRTWRTSTWASVFGTVYDVSTIAILWFAGASAMAGLLNLVPRYLPRYGMAPDWARAVRPLVLVFTVVAFWSPGSSTRASTRRAARTRPASWC